MTRTNLFFKVEVDLEADEQPQRISDQICRLVRKVYGVRNVELSSITKVED